MVKWFDPIGEKWHVMPEPPAPVRSQGNEPPANAMITAANECLWRALVASATSSHMSEGNDVEAGPEDPVF